MATPIIPKSSLPIKTYVVRVEMKFYVQARDKGMAKIRAKNLAAAAAAVSHGIEVTDCVEIESAK